MPSFTITRSQYGAKQCHFGIEASYTPFTCTISSNCPQSRLHSKLGRQHWYCSHTRNNYNIHTYTKMTYKALRNMCCREWHHSHHRIGWHLTVVSSQAAVQPLFVLWGLLCGGQFVHPIGSSTLHSGIQIVMLSNRCLTTRRTEGNEVTNRMVWWYM